MDEFISACDETGLLLPPEELEPGDRVRMAAGPFQDLMATVEKIASKDRVWLLIDGKRMPLRLSANREFLTKDQTVSS